MKKIVIFMAIAALFFSGCMIKVIPLNDGRIPLPPASSGLEFHTYGSGWGWPLLRSPGVSWGHRNYQYNNNYGPRKWVPGHYE
jgi:hypothetical protein